MSDSIPALHVDAVLKNQAEDQLALVLFTMFAAAAGEFAPICMRCSQSSAADFFAR